MTRERVVQLEVVLLACLALVVWGLREIFG